MCRYRLHHSLGRRLVIRRLHQFTRRHFSTRKCHPQQKITDAYLLALLLARFIFKVPFASIWWNMLREDRSGLPSYTQAFTRGQRLLEHLEAMVSPAEECALTPCHCQFVVPNVGNAAHFLKHVGDLALRATSTGLSCTPGFRLLDGYCSI